MSWINEFTEKLFPLDRKKLDIEGAYFLKDCYLPKSIYKYREINKDSIKNLKEDTIWLADPSNFNDPYDCAHTVDFASLSKHRGTEVLEAFLDDKGSNIEFDDETKSYLLQSSDPIDAFGDYLLKNEPKEIREAFKSTLSSVIDKRHEDLVKENSRAISNSFKLCSFSERNDSMLMWAHYASYHQGFCIEYDIESIPCSDYRRRFLYPTIYSDFMFDATEYYKKGVEDENFNNLHLSMLALVKAKDWQYEKEWRLVFSHGILEKEKSYVWGKSKAVYLGSKIEISDQDMLIEICNDKDIPIYKMKAHHNKFLLEATDLKNAEQHFFKRNA